uniref:Small ribosomal subunit protein uS7m n=1 Tax=Loa loa TaxID=7209 RepID=A0A1I7VIG9_LOALO
MFLLTRCFTSGHITSALLAYDPKVFREPIVDLEQVVAIMYSGNMAVGLNQLSLSFIYDGHVSSQLALLSTIPFTALNQPLDPEDDRRYCYIKAMTSVQTPVFYRNAVIDRLINVCMLRGMKEKMQNIVLEALEIIKRRQYNLWRNASDEQKEKIELDPVAITEKAIKNCCPIMILRPFIRGGQTYMVPCPISEHHAEFRAMKTMRDICRQKTFHGATHFQHILADELLAAYKNEGLTVQAKQELHKQCEANRAYVHYRRQ